MDKSSSDMGLCRAGGDVADGGGGGEWFMGGRYPMSTLSKGSAVAASCQYAPDKSTGRYDPSLKESQHGER